MSNTASKPWPRDCIPLFCEPSESAMIPNMTDINFGVCSDCGRAISYDTKTMAEAEEMGFLTGMRPVKLFCLRCLPQYNFLDVDLFIDYSGGTGVREYVRRPDETP